MVCVLGPEAERLLFGLPLVVALHNHHAPVLDVLEEGLFSGELFNPAVDDHIEVCFLAPPHESQLSVGFVFFVLSLIGILNFLWFIFIQSLLNSLLEWFRFLCWFCGFVAVDLAALDHRDVCGGAHIKGGGVKLLVTNSRSSGDSQEPAKWKSLKQTAAHGYTYLLIYTYYLSWASLQAFWWNKYPLFNPSLSHSLKYFLWTNWVWVIDWRI